MRVDMLVEVVIFMILVAVVLMNATGRTICTRDIWTQAHLFHLGGKVDLFKLEKARYPERLEDLVPEYLEEVPLDAWDRGFRYSTPGSNNRPFEIVSLGEDGKEGGLGFDADLSSHPVRR